MLYETYTAIAQIIRSTLANEYDVLFDFPEQGRNTPYFYITVVNPSQEPKLGNQYLRIQPFEIQYFSKSENYTKECIEIAEKLFEILEYIQMDGRLIQGSGMNFKLEDGILYFYVNYNMIIVKDNKEDVLMSDLNAKSNLKEGE